MAEESSHVAMADEGPNGGDNVVHSNVSPVSPHRSLSASGSAVGSRASSKASSKVSKSRSRSPLASSHGRSRSRSRSRRTSYSSSSYDHHRRRHRSRSRSRSRRSRHSRSRDRRKRLRSQQRKHRQRSQDRSRRRRHRHRSPSRYHSRSRSRGRSSRRSKSRSPQRQRPASSNTDDSRLLEKLVSLLDKNKDSAAAPAASTAPSSVPSSPTRTEVPPDPKQPTGSMKQLVDKWNKQKKNTDPTTSAISEFLLPILETWWWQPFDKEDIKETLGLCLRPENAEVLKKVHINEEVFKRIGPKGRQADEGLRYINHALTRAAQPLALAWDQVISAENCFKDHDEADASGNVTIALPDGSGLNLSDVRNCLDLALKVLGMTNVQLVLKRRAALKEYLNKDYQALCDHSHPFNWQMFGSNLRGQIDELNKFNKLASQVTASSSASKKPSPAAQAWRNRFLGGQNQGQQKRRNHQWNSSQGYRHNPRYKQNQGRQNQNQNQNQFQKHNPRGRPRRY